MGTIREVVRKDGTSSFHAEVRIRGYSPQRASFRNKSLAKKWIQNTESSIRDGRHFKTVEAKRHTVEEMIDRFIEQWLPRYPQSRVKQTALLTWWKNSCGHLLLSDLTPAVIAECRDHLLKEITVRGEVRSGSTVNRYLAAFGKVMMISVKEWGWMEDSPMRRVSKPAEAPGRERFLSLEEKTRLLEECQRSRNPNLFAMVSLSLLTAMRYSELAGLRWKDVSIEQRTITLCRTKNGDRRVIPLTQEAEMIFRSCPTFGTSQDALIFQSRNSPKSDQIISVRGAFARALANGKIKKFRWHDLRHSAASYMAMNGATQGELMAILGHRSPAMTRRYSHFSQGHLASLLERTSSSIIRHATTKERFNDNGLDSTVT